MVNGGNNNVGVYLRNAGNTGFDAILAVGSFPTALTVGDLNGDGKTGHRDSKRGSADVSVLLRNAPNNGSDPAANLTVGVSNAGVAIADFNGAAEATS